jgi:hypothetical protein
MFSPLFGANLHFYEEPLVPIEKKIKIILILVLIQEIILGRFGCSKK